MRLRGCSRGWRRSRRGRQPDPDRAGVEMLGSCRDDVRRLHMRMTVCLIAGDEARRHDSQLVMRCLSSPVGKINNTVAAIIRGRKRLSTVDQKPCSVDLDFTLMTRSSESIKQSVLWEEHRGDR